jgi:hypothetical protein
MPQTSDINESMCDVLGEFVSSGQSEDMFSNAVGGLPLGEARRSAHVDVTREIQQHKPRIDATLPQEHEMGEPVRELIEMHTPLILRMSRSSIPMFPEVLHR